MIFGPNSGGFGGDVNVVVTMANKSGVVSILIMMTVGVTVAVMKKEEVLMEYFYKV